MSKSIEHGSAVKEYAAFVDTMEEIEGKLHIVTLEKQQIVTQFTSAGWIIDGIDATYEGMEQMLMERSSKFSQLFHKTLFDRLNAIASNQEDTT